MKTPTERSLDIIAKQLEKLTNEVKLLRKTVAEHGIAIFPGVCSEKNEDEEKPDEELSDFDIASMLI